MRPLAALTAPLILLCAAGACASSGAVTHWNRVQKLSAGTEIRLLVDGGTFVERRFVSADSSMLQVADKDSTETVPAAQVVMITTDTHPKQVGATIGGLLGILHGAAAISCSQCPGQAIGTIAMAVALDAALGAYIASDRPPHRVVYQRP